MIKRSECNLCGSAGYDVIYKSKKKEGGKSGRLFKCNSCGLVFAMREKDTAFYKEKYAEMLDGEYGLEERGKRKQAAMILKRIERHKGPGKILDVGCSNAFFLDEAKRRGWVVSGVEASKKAHFFARDKFNIDLGESPFEETPFPNYHFDVVIMLDMLEYLTDPKCTLLELRRILKRDGILYISAPNVSSLLSKIFRSRWWGMERRHLFYFSKRTLERMLDACGFKVKKYAPHIRIFSLSYWVERMRGKSALLHGVLGSIARIGGLGNIRLSINMYDQIEVLGGKVRRLDFLASSATAKKKRPPRRRMKTFVVLPAYNAEKTLKRTIDDIPRDRVDKIILVDDSSKDKTFEVALRLGIEAYRHKKNMGYGANQKTCYEKALKEGAEIVVMVHPDYQYDPAVIPNLIEPIERGEADAVFGSRMIKGGALEGGMPLWKHNVNILLTALENVVLGTYLTEYHSGFRAYSGDLLRTVNFEQNSNNFVFDTEIIVQALVHRFTIAEIPIKTRYFDEASKIKLLPAILYGLGILGTMLKYILFVKGIYKFRQFS